jgi:hypothetical protein
MNRLERRNRRVLVIKKDEIYCIECCCRSMSKFSVTLDNKEYKVCLNPSCSMYGKPVTNWSIE